MRVALVRAGVVDSVAVVGEGFRYPEDLTLVRLSDDQHPTAGDRYDGSTFRAGPVDDSAVAARVQALDETTAAQQEVLDAVVTRMAEL